MRKIIFPVLISFLLPITLFAGGGMWLPFLLGQLNEADMQSLGMKMTAEDIYSVNKGSLKDAIVHFNGGCSSSIISPQGLLLTNHHCGYSAIQTHSTLEKNYLENGFWAEKQSDELPNDNLVATFIDRIEDVTKDILVGVTDKMTTKERNDKISQNIKAFKKAYAKKKYEDVLIKPFFKGNQYILFVTITYTDVRLVGAPPSAIGKFGADTDNWEWPRHSGDFSLFRIYANKDNLPADYSPDNQPLKPKHYLPISLDGVDAGDFTLVYGFPGRTDEYLPSYAVAQIQNAIDPARIEIRDHALKILDKAMRNDPTIRLQYASKYARIANYWKKWIGERTGLIKTKAVEKKQKLEQEFTRRLAENPELNKKYGSLLDDMDYKYQEIELLAIYRNYFHELFFRNIEIFKPANSLRRFLAQANEENYDQLAGSTKKSLQAFFKDYQPAVDRDVFKSLMQLYTDNVCTAYFPNYLLEERFLEGYDMEQLAKEFYDNSIMTQPEKLYQLIDDKKTDEIKKDPVYQLFMDIVDAYRTRLNPEYQAIKAPIDSMQRRYMAALMEVLPEKKYYPDANGTMRVSYGQVEGYLPKDGVEYLPKTYMEGIIEKYVPGDYEFDLPQRLLDLYEAKDYGPYAENGRLPINFLGSNHTTGGNSGSPVIDAYGNLIGLNFDRVWEGTMSDLNYDRRICRNIMVDIRYVMWVMDKYAGAQRLVDEVQLVHPKAGQKSSKPWDGQKKRKRRKRW
ncbi:MAG TPA: S46 family peptidase [Saprospiraceae bacterium]|nr:S46 family peptidase [Saprospiraceae bacterium]